MAAINVGGSSKKGRIKKITENLTTSTKEYNSKLNDLKSLLPGYDEVSDYAYHYSSKLNSPAIPKAGRTINKLNIEELPTQLGETIPIPKIKGPASFNALPKGKLTDKYDLMSKFDASVLNPDTKLTQMAATRLKMDIKKKVPIKSNPSIDLLKIKSDIMDGIETDLGFGFRSKIGNEEINIGNWDTDFQNLNGGSSSGANKKKIENSVQALKKRINRKKEEWKTEEFGWDGYNYKGAADLNNSKAESLNISKDEPKNEKLSVMSRKFQKSLKINTDMRSAIKTPKMSKLLESSSAESIERRSGSMNEKLPGQKQEPDDPSSLLTRSSALYVPLKKKAGKGVKIKKLESKINDVEMDVDTKNHNSRVIQLKSLLEGGQSEQLIEKSKKGHKPIDFNSLKQVTSALAYPPSPREKIKMEMATSPRLPEAKIISENFYRSSTAKSEKKVGVEDFIKQRLGESVKTVYDASLIAKRLGSLMTRVAMSKNKGQNNNNDVMDTVSLAKELRELAATMEKDYGLVGVGSSQTGSSSGLNFGSGNVQTQTEKFVKDLPQPKFTKHMSYTDQLVLRKLREIRKFFEN